MKSADEASASAFPNLAWQILKIKNAEANVDIRGIDFNAIMLNPKIL